MIRNPALTAPNLISLNNLPAVFHSASSGRLVDFLVFQDMSACKFTRSDTITSRTISTQKYGDAWKCRTTQNKLPITPDTGLFMGNDNSKKHAI